MSGDRIILGEVRDAAACELLNVMNAGLEKSMRKTALIILWKMLYLIQIKNVKEDIAMHLIGKLNKDIYKCVTEDIVTDEVVITDNQIEHIKERHPNDYERFSQYFSEIVSAPDYIIKANRKNTAVILKEIVDKGEHFQTVLRLCTSVEPEGYKNSIITFLKIDKKDGTAIWGQSLFFTNGNKSGILFIC